MEGIERLESLILGQKDKALNKVVEYLITRVDMNIKYINIEKSLKGMTEFIRGEAKKQAENGVAIIEDEVVYGWAIHYFDESNEKLGINRKPDNNAEEIEVEKVVNIKPKIVKIHKQDNNIEQISLF